MNDPLNLDVEQYLNGLDNQIEADVPQGRRSEDSFDITPEQKEYADLIQSISGQVANTEAPVRNDGLFETVGEYASHGLKNVVRGALSTLEQPLHLADRVLFDDREFDGIADDIPQSETFMGAVGEGLGQLAGLTGTALVSGPLAAFTAGSQALNESNSTYESALAEGATEEDAQDAYLNSLPFNIGSAAIDFIISGGPRKILSMADGSGKLLKKVASRNLEILGRAEKVFKAGSPIKQTLKTGLAEGAEETIQEAANKAAVDEAVDPDKSFLKETIMNFADADVLRAGAVGFITGSTYGGLSSVKTKDIKNGINFLKSAKDSAKDKTSQKVASVYGKLKTVTEGTNKAIEFEADEASTGEVKEIVGDHAVVYKMGNKTVVRRKAVDKFQPLYDTLVQEIEADEQQRSQGEQVFSDVAPGGEVQQQEIQGAFPDFNIETQNDNPHFIDDPSILPVNEGRFERLPEAVGMLKALGGKVSVGKLNEALRGYAKISDGKVVLNAKIFRDERQASRTFVHEIGHVLSYKPIAKALGISSANNLDVVLNNMDYKKGAKGLRELTLMVRPYNPSKATPEYNAYRNSRDELFADALSAYIHYPKEARRVAPRVITQLEDSISKSAALSKQVATAQTYIQDAIHNQDRAFELDGGIVAENAQEAQDSFRSKKKVSKEPKNQLGLRESLKKLWDSSKQNVLGKFTPLDDLSRDIARTEAGAADLRQDFREVADFTAQQISQYKRWFTDEIVTPLRENDISHRDFTLYTVANRVIHETNRNQQNLEADPRDYAESLKGFVDFIEQGNDTFNVNLRGIKKPIQDFLDGKATEQDLVSALGKLEERLEQDIPINKNLSLSKGYKIAQEAKKSGVLDENTKGFIDQGFNIRRYMANPFGLTKQNSQDLINNIEQVYDENQFNKMQDLAVGFSNQLFQIAEAQAAAGIISRDRLAQMKLNKDHYVPFAVDAFIQIDDLGQLTGIQAAQYRKQVGTLASVAPVLDIGIEKIMRGHVAANRQMTSNMIIAALAGDPNYGVKRLSTAPNRKGDITQENIFDMQRQYQDTRSKQLNKSYMILANNGKKYLYEVDDIKWQRVVQANPRVVAPWAKTLMSVGTTFNSIIAPIAIYNPLKVYYKDFVRDRKTESLLLTGSTAGALNPFRMANFWLNEENRQMLGQAKALSKEALKVKTGEMKLEDASIELQEAVALGAVVDPSAFEASRAYGYEAKNVEDFTFDYWAGETARLESVDRLVKKTGNALDAISPQITQRTRELGNFFVNKAFETEYKTKLMGYIASQQVHNFTPTQAAQYANRQFGTPDPFSRGRMLNMVAPFFLFANSHYNSLRAVYQGFSGANNAKRQSKQWGAAVASSAITAALISDDDFIETFFGLFGAEDAGRNMASMYRKLSKYDRMYMSSLPLATIDSDGSVRSVLSALTNPEPISQTSKVIALRMPVDHNEMAAREAAINTIRELKKGDYIGTVTAMAGAMFNAVMHGVSPFVETGIHATRIVADGNSTDMFTGQPIYDDLDEQNQSYEKFMQFVHYAVSKNTGLVRYSAFDKESESFVETLSRNVPVVSNQFGALVKVTNSGENADAQESKILKRMEKQRYLSNAGDSMRALQKMVSNSDSKVARFGKANLTESEDELRSRYLNGKEGARKLLKSYIEEMRTHNENGTDPGQVPDKFEALAEVMMERINNAKE